MTNFTVTLETPATNVRQEVLSGSVVFVGAQLNVSILGLNGVLADTDGDGVSDSITFYFPSMWNSPNNVADDEDKIIVEVITVVANVSAPVFNRVANSKVTMAYQAPFKTNNVALTLTFPTPVITKTASQPTYPESGTTIAYVVTITNRAPSSPAYMLTIRDLLSPNLRLVPETLTTSVGQIVTGNGEGNSTIEITHPRLLVGETVSIRYSAVLTNVVNASMEVYNTAGVEYLSAIPASYNVVQNRRRTEYADSKVIIATPEISVGVSSTNLGQVYTSTAAVGQINRLLVKVIIPQGTTAAAQLNVQLPNTSVGLMQVISSAIVAFPPNINSSAGLVNGSLAVVTDNNGDGYEDLCTYDFGNLLNYPDGVSKNENDTIVVEIYAVLVNHGYNLRGDILSTRATLNYHTGVSQTNVQTSLSTTVVEPVLTVSQTASSSVPTYTEGGVVIDYTVTIAQVSTTNRFTAFDLILTDALTPYTSLIVGSVVPSAGVVVKGNNQSDTTVHVALSSYLTSASNIVIRYSVLVLDNAQPGARITSTAVFNCFSIPLALGGSNTRPLPLNATSFFDMTTIKTTSVIRSSSIPETNTYFTAIGEVVTFTSTNTIPQGTTANAVFVINAPSSCQGVSACSTTGRMHFVAPPSITFMSSNFNSSTGLTLGSLASSLTDTNNDGYMDTATFDFGDLLNIPDGVSAGVNDTIVVTGSVLAVDHTLNYNDKQTYVYTTFSYTGLAVPKSVNSYFLIQFVEPHMYLTHSVSDLDYPQAGEVQTYTISILHYSDATGPAYNNTVNNTMNPQLRLVPGSVVISGGKGGVVISGNTTDDTVHLVVSLNAFVKSDPTVIITYKAIVQNVTLAATWVPSSATLEYWSAPTDQYNSANRRPQYSNAGKSFYVPEPTMGLALTGTSIDESSEAVVAVGELIRITSTLLFPQGTTGDVSFSFMSTPSFPGYLSIVNASIIFMASNIKSARDLVQGSVITPVDTNADGIFDLATFEFGDILNIQEGATKAITDSIVIEINVVVSETYNYHGLPLDALGTLSYTTGIKYVESTSRVAVTVATPSLNVVKSSVLLSDYIEAGSSINYTITITPTVANAPAFQGVLTDLLGPRFELQNDTLTLTHGTYLNYTKDGDLTIRVPDGFSYGSVMTITYVATLTTAVYASTQVDNTASLFFYSAPDSETGNLRSWTIQSTTSIAVASPSLSVSLSSSSLPQALPRDVAIGSTIKFLASVVVPQGSTGNVVFNITLPNGTNGKFKALSSTIVKMASNFASNTSLKEGDEGILVDSNNDNITDRVTYSFGTLVNTPDLVSQGFYYFFLFLLIFCIHTLFQVRTTPLVLRL